ncbi:hypothetical protein CPB85DRAFT_1521117 [Mucidula mucida]|nr:hypothetical protein CPB85DRAFT_1521117 [Mucidula mucida]
MADTSAQLPHDNVIFAGISSHVTTVFVVPLRCLNRRTMSLKTLHTTILDLHNTHCPRLSDEHTAIGRIWSHPNLTYNEVAVDSKILRDYKPSDSAVALDISRDGDSFVSDHIPAYQTATPGDFPLSFVIEIVDNVTPIARPKRLAPDDTDHPRPTKQQKTSGANVLPVQRTGDSRVTTQTSGSRLAPQDSKRIDLDARTSLLGSTWPLDSEDVNHLTSDFKESVHTFWLAPPQRRCFDDNNNSELKLENIRRIGQHLLSSLGPEQVLPSPHVSDIQQLLAQPGMLLVDKTHGVSVIDHCDPYNILILCRPRGFGMKTFLSMVSQVCDDLSSPTLIEALYPMDEEAYFPPAYPVLRLDLSKVSADTSTIKQLLQEYMNLQIRQLWLKYDHIYGCQDIDMFLKSTPGVTLENYDSPVLRARPEDRAAVMHYMDSEFMAALVMSHMSGHCIRTILTSEMVTDAYTGIHLDRLEKYSHDLTHDAALQEAFGFTEKEIRALDGALEGKNPAAGDVIQDLHERGIEAYNFNTSSESTFEFSGLIDAVYSMQEVLDVLAQRIGKPNRQ